MDIDDTDSLGRFGKLKVEATSFTISDPIDNMMVPTLLFELSTKEIQDKIKEQNFLFSMEPFQIKVIRLKS